MLRSSLLCHPASVLFFWPCPSPSLSYASFLTAPPLPTSSPDTPPQISIIHSFTFSTQCISHLLPPFPPTQTHTHVQHTHSNLLWKMKTKSRLPKYFYSCSLTKQGLETMWKDVQAYFSQQQKDGKLFPCGLFQSPGKPPPFLLPWLKDPAWNTHLTWHHI